MWIQCGFAAVLAFIWLLGLLTGALQPISVLMSIGLVGLMTWLVAAVGMHYSLKATRTSRALVSTIVALCLLNGFPFVQFLWFRGVIQWDASFAWLGFMPTLAVVAARVTPVRGASGGGVTTGHGDAALLMRTGELRPGRPVPARRDLRSRRGLSLTRRVVGPFDDVLARPRLRASPPRRKGS